MTNMKCEECGKNLEFGNAGVCKCGKELCYDCYLANGHREHMQNMEYADEKQDSEELE